MLTDTGCSAAPVRAEPITYSRTVLDITADISGLTTGQMYYFKVQPYREISGVRTYFPYSAAASVQIMATPVITSAAPAGEGKALIRWNAVAGAGAYILYRSTSLSGTFSYLKTTASTSSRIQALPPHFLLLQSPRVPHLFL